MALSRPSGLDMQWKSPPISADLAGALPVLSHFEGWICGLGTSQRVIIGSAEMAQHPSFAGSPPRPQAIVERHHCEAIGEITPQGNVSNLGRSSLLLPLSHHGDQFHAYPCKNAEI